MLAFCSSQKTDLIQNFWKYRKKKKKRKLGMCSKKSPALSFQHLKTIGCCPKISHSSKSLTWYQTFICLWILCWGLQDFILSKNQRKLIPIQNCQKNEGKRIYNFPFTVNTVRQIIQVSFLFWHTRGDSSTSK